MLISLSCEPISVPDDSREYNAQAWVNAIASTDTVQVNQPVPVQINFRNVCGGSLVGVQLNTSSGTAGIDSGRVTLSPTLHINPDAQCNGSLPWQTVTDTIYFDQQGYFTLAIDAGNIVVKKYIRAVNATLGILPQYVLRFAFIDSHSAPDPNQQAALVFPEKNLNLTIQADGNGVWDTVFTDAAAKLRYTLNGAEFTAVKGYTSSAIVVVQ